LIMEEKIGYNAMALMDEQDELDMRNIDTYFFCNGKDKVFPYGPTMNYNGKQVSCYVTSTENGSITGEELTLMLKWMDDLEIFEQSDSVDPMFIVDGHISRMMGPFLEYVNDPVHRWSAMLGIPYVTNLWQVGDSAQMNGAFKISMTKWKRWLRQQKADFGLKQSIEKHAIMLLFTLAWKKSFALVANNKKACDDRSWNPLNFALMEHDDMKEGHRTEVECSVSHTSMLAFNTGQALVEHATLNKREGFSKTIVNQMVEAVLKKIEEEGTDLTLLSERRRATLYTLETKIFYFILN
jgi:hypothetical protein